MAAPFYQLLSQNFKLYTQIMKKSCQLYHWNISWIWPALDFSVGSVVKNLPTMWETQVWFLGWEDPLEEEVATHSSILAWRISWTEEPSRLQSMGSQRIGHRWATNTFISLTTYLIQTAICFHRNNFSDLLIGYSFKFLLPHSTFIKAIHFHLLKSRHGSLLIKALLQFNISE